MNRALELGQEPIDHITLSVDTSDKDTAHRLIDDFRTAGGSIVKLGLQAASSFGGPEGLSALAQEHGALWAFDGKIKDIETTMAAAIRNIVTYDYPPVAITMHADTSFKGMRVAQETAGDVLMLGVTLLTDISPEEAFEDYSNEEERRLVERGKLSIAEAGELVRVRTVVARGRKLGKAGVKGLVASPQELVALNEDEITQSRFKMIPGTRSTHAQSNDQKNTMTPEEAIANGADLLVLGRQYTKAGDKAKELRLFKDEVARGLERRAVA